MGSNRARPRRTWLASAVALVAVLVTAALLASPEG